MNELFLHSEEAYGFDDLYGEEAGDLYEGMAYDAEEFWPEAFLEEDLPLFFEDDLSADLEHTAMLEELDGLAEAYDGYDPSLFDEVDDMAEGLRAVLREDYADASSEEVHEALFDILETMSPAEGFSFAKALKQIGKAGKRVLRDPKVSQIAGTVLPVAGAAIGTVYGGPAGTAVGSQLGNVAASAFKGARKQRTTPAGRAQPGRPDARRPTAARRPSRTTTRLRPAASARPSPQGGSSAAAQLLTLTQNPEILKSLMALALGAQGRAAVNPKGSRATVPVGAVVNLLATLTRRAARDAEALYGGEQSLDPTDGEGYYGSQQSLYGEALYAEFLRGETQDIIEAEAINDVLYE